MLLNLKVTTVSFMFSNSNYNRVLHHRNILQNFTINGNIYDVTKKLVESLRNLFISDKVLPFSLTNVIFDVFLGLFTK